MATACLTWFCWIATEMLIVFVNQPDQFAERDSGHGPRPGNRGPHDPADAFARARPRADYYKLTVPTEAFAGAGDQVLDFSGGFANEEGAGLMMEVLDAAGNVLAAGERIRLVAEQGEELFVHVFASGADAGGAYTLVINTLPQVAAIEAHSLLPGVGELPGGPTTSLVLRVPGRPAQRRLGGEQGELHCPLARSRWGPRRRRRSGNRDWYRAARELEGGPVRSEPQ